MATSATIRKKDELLELFADGQDRGSITPDRVRDFIVSNLTFAASAVVIPTFNIPVELEYVVMGQGSSLANLPDVDAYGARTLHITNVRGQSVQISPVNGQTIGGESGITLEHGQDLRLVGDPRGDDWIAEISTNTAFYVGKGGQIPTVKDDASGIEARFIDEARIFLFQENSIEPTGLTALNTPTPVQCTLTGREPRQVDVNGSTITYTGRRDLVAMIAWNFSVERVTGGGPGTRYGFEVSKNGQSGNGRITMDLTNMRENAGITTAVRISQGDTLTFRCAALAGDLRDLIVTDQTILITAR